MRVSNVSSIVCNPREFPFRSCNVLGVQFVRNFSHAEISFQFKGVWGNGRHSFAAPNGVQNYLVLWRVIPSFSEIRCVNINFRANLNRSFEIKKNTYSICSTFHFWYNFHNFFKPKAIPHNKIMLVKLISTLKAMMKFCEKRNTRLKVLACKIWLF